MGDVNNNGASSNNSSTILSIILVVILVAELGVAGFLRPGFFRQREDADSQYAQTNSGAETGVTTSTGVSGNESAKDKGNDSSQASSVSTGFEYVDYVTTPDWEPDPEGDGDYQLSGNWSSEQVASGTLTEDSLSIVGKDGASMTIAECYLEEDTKAEIRKVPGTVDYKVGDETIPLTLYEFNAEGISDDTYMTLEFPFSVDADEEVGAGFYDPSAGTIWPVNFEYDDQKGMIRIKATHLSTYCGFKVKDAGTRRAMLPFLSYADLYSVMNATGGTDLKKDAEILEKSAKAGSSWSAADEIADDLGTIGSKADTVVSSLGVVGSLESAMTVADGAGNVIVKNSYGTIGEIMNTMWGKRGSWGVARRYGGAVTVTEIEDKLKSTYPGDKIDRIGNGLNVLNTTLSCFKILQHAQNGDNTAAAWESTQLIFDRTLAVVAEKMAFPALNVYLVGVSLLTYALNEFYTEAMNGRKEVYVKAYYEYYNSRDTDGGYRSAATWRKKFIEIMKAGGGIKGVEAEIDNYVNEFWVKADDFGLGYIDSILTEDQKTAWGAAGQAGLNPKIKKEISDNYKAEIIPSMINIMEVVNEKNMDEIQETYKARYEALCREMNQVMTISVIDGGKEADKDSAYEGCIVRFKGLKGKVSDPQNWETKLDKNGQGQIRLTFLAHMMVNAGNILEVVKKDGDKETIVLEQSFDIKLPQSKVILDFPEVTGPDWINGIWSEPGGNTLIESSTGYSIPAMRYKVLDNKRIAVDIIMPISGQPGDVGEPLGDSTIATYEYDPTTEKIVIHYDGSTTEKIRREGEDAIFYEDSHMSKPLWHRMNGLNIRSNGG